MPNDEADDALKMKGEADDALKLLDSLWELRKPRPLSKEEYDQLRSRSVVRGALTSPSERKQDEWASSAEVEQYRSPITSETLKGWGAEKWDRPELAAQGTVEDRRAAGLYPEVSRLSIGLGNVGPNASAQFERVRDWTRGKLGIQQSPPSQLQIDAGLNDASAAGDRLWDAYYKKRIKQLNPEAPMLRATTEAYVRTAGTLGLPVAPAPAPPPPPPSKQPPTPVPTWSASGPALADDAFSAPWQRNSGP